MRYAYVCIVYCVVSCYIWLIGYTVSSNTRWVLSIVGNILIYLWQFLANPSIVIDLFVEHQTFVPSEGFMSEPLKVNI